MKYRILLLSIIMICTVSFLSAQDTGNYVDVKKTNKKIEILEMENTEHEDIIADNNDRKIYLEKRISESENRIVKINENKDYAVQKNLEVNKLNSETNDKKTKNKIEEYRDDIVSLIRILKTELKTVEKQIKNDKSEISFLAKDSTRRENLIEKNKKDIASMKSDVAATKSRISEISTTLDEIKGQIDSFREEVKEESAS